MAALNIVIQLTFLTAIQLDRMLLITQIGLPLKNNFTNYYGHISKRPYKMGKKKPRIYWLQIKQS